MVPSWKSLIPVVLCLTLVSCGGQDSQTGLSLDDLDDTELSGTWKLASIRPLDGVSVVASQDAFDALLAFGEGKTFELTEWMEGESALSFGVYTISGDKLSLIHTGDGHVIAARVDETVYTAVGNTLTLTQVLLGVEHTVYVYERQG